MEEKRDEAWYQARLDSCKEKLPRQEDAKAQDKEADDEADPEVEAHVKSMSERDADLFRSAVTFLGSVDKALKDPMVIDRARLASFEGGLVNPVSDENYARAVELKYKRMHNFIESYGLPTYTASGRQIGSAMWDPHGCWRRGCWPMPRGGGCRQNVWSPTQRGRPWVCSAHACPTGCRRTATRSTGSVCTCSARWQCTAWRGHCSAQIRVMIATVRRVVQCIHRFVQILYKFCTT